MEIRTDNIRGIMVVNNIMLMYLFFFSRYIIIEITYSWGKEIQKPILVTYM